MNRLSVDVDGAATSYLAAGDTGPVVLLLHGTYWSRVWEPVIDDLAAAGLRPIAVDLPGFGRSGGELSPAAASVPELAKWSVRFLKALSEVDKPIVLAGHDIGGGIAQQMFVDGEVAVTKLILMNAVMFDSWPAPTVLKFRDPKVAAAVTQADVLAGRKHSVTLALARPADAQEIADWLDPWNDPRVARSWLSMAIAADHQHTTRLVPALKVSNQPKLLIWGEDDDFQKVEFAERFVTEIPNSRLVRVKKAGHIPTANDAAGIAQAMIEFLGEP